MMVPDSADIEQTELVEEKAWREMEWRSQVIQQGPPPQEIEEQSEEIQVERKTQVFLIPPLFSSHTHFIPQEQLTLERREKKDKAIMAELMKRDGVPAIVVEWDCRPIQTKQPCLESWKTVVVDNIDGYKFSEVAYQRYPENIKLVNPCGDLVGHTTHHFASLDVVDSLIEKIENMPLQLLNDKRGKRYGHTFGLLLVVCYPLPPFDLHVFFQIPERTFHHSSARSYQKPH